MFIKQICEYWGENLKIGLVCLMAQITYQRLLNDTLRDDKGEVKNQRQKIYFHKYPQNTSMLTNIFSDRKYFTQKIKTISFGESSKFTRKFFFRRNRNSAML